MADPLRGLGQVTPATRLKAAEIVAAAEAAGHTVLIVWGYNPASRPEHLDPATMASLFPGMNRRKAKAGGPAEGSVIPA